MEIKDRIKGTIVDMVADLLYYDRKDDEELPRGVIEEAIEDGKITIGDIVGAFSDALIEILYEKDTD